MTATACCFEAGQGVFEEGMIHDALDGDALDWVDQEEGVDEADESGVVDMSREVELSFLDAVGNVDGRGPVEREAAADDRKQHHACAPDVQLWPDVGDAFEHFRGRIVGRSAELVKPARGSPRAREVPVGEIDVFTVLIEQDVF